MPLLEDVGAYLAAQGLGTVGTDIYLGVMSDAPDTAVALYEEGGQAPEPLWGGERPGLLIRTRSTTRPLARAKAYQAYKLLYNVTNATMGATVYHRVDARSGVVQLGRDLKGRYLYSVGFDVIKDME